jgi:hypothetical protein
VKLLADEETRTRNRPKNRWGAGGYPSNFKNKALSPEPDITEMLSLDGCLAAAGNGSPSAFDRCSAATVACLLSLEETQTIQEVPMVGMRNDRARARARDLLATIYPLPDDPELNRLRELAVDYIREAERLEAGHSGCAAESDELISAALDAVARDYFARAIGRARSHGKG